MAVVVTGFAPHSIGESLVEHLRFRSLDTPIICIDIEPNSWLRAKVHYQDVRLNLNPLQHPGGFANFGAHVTRELRTALSATKAKSITHLIQCAGVYWAGSLNASLPETRSTVYGVNLLGHIEVLHAVMRINAECGVSNASSLIHIELGSSHGLNPRQQRALYASSKSCGIDFGASLDAGAEVFRYVYVAAGPVDTHMLHHNHWVIKAGGPESLIQELKSGSRSTYNAVFIECSDQEFGTALSTKRLATELFANFAAYKRCRQEAASDELGILTAEECSSLIVNAALSPEAYPSGVYLPRKRKGQKANVDYKSFDEMKRFNVFTL
jgi:short-subunit dehydrogenase